MLLPAHFLTPLPHVKLGDLFGDYVWVILG
jgi:hypothetical protein